MFVEVTLVLHTYADIALLSRR
ncbi:Protein of unknown function [Pyronema omphalodes CBS 100304]|uniref:Uncharacterized protein n=1 Tax=Pyronema omphalodes (strain CBS 100304) TaxID=1076935 RepID=U4L8G3_PYROM|nr:Protein of unknown function [Pyronema omphalodes CBS 100304]